MKYLGFEVSNEVKTDKAMKTRINAAAGAMRDLKSTLCCKNIEIKLRGKLYVSLVLSILLYGSECWSPTKESFNQVIKFHNTCVRSMCGLNTWGTWHQRITSAELNERLGIFCVESYYSTRLLRWAGHVARMPISRLPKKFLTGGITGVGNGTVRSAWHTNLFRVLAWKGINGNNFLTKAQDKSSWRSLIAPTEEQNYTCCMQTT